MATGTLIEWEGIMRRVSSGVVLIGCIMLTSACSGLSQRLIGPIAAFAVKDARAAQARIDRAVQRQVVTLDEGERLRTCPQAVLTLDEFRQNLFADDTDVVGLIDAAVAANIVKLRQDDGAHLVHRLIAACAELLPAEALIGG